MNTFFSVFGATIAQVRAVTGKPILETTALPMSYGVAEPLLRAAADRFAVMNDFSRGSFVYDRYLLCPNPTAQGLQHAAEWVMDVQTRWNEAFERLAEVLEEERSS